MMRMRCGINHLCGYDCDTEQMIESRRLSRYENEDIIDHEYKYLGRNALTYQIRANTTGDSLGR